MASSVAEPEVPQDPNGANGTNGLKRRQSDASEQESKRQRTTPGKSSPTSAAVEQEPQAKDSDTSSTTKPILDTTEDTRDLRKKKGPADEKQRSKRLFGALLGNLNRPSDRVSKRRSEIEQRRKAELQKQDDERLEDRQRRLEKLAEQRKREQIKVDEQNMRTRHENLLNAANFLQTKTEPKIYYKPWDLLPDEEDRIDDQIRDAKAQIDEEVAEFEAEKRKRLSEVNDNEEKEPTTAPTETGDPAPEKVASPAKAPDADKPDEGADQQASTEPTNPTDVPGPEVPESDDAKERHSDEAGKKEDATVDADEKETSNANNEEAAKDTEPQKAVDEQKEEVEEEGDHVVVGDEDTVEY